MRVLDRHRRIVDQYADSKSEPAERHGVERVPEEIERDERSEDGEGNRDHDDQRRPPRPEEEKDHQRRQRARDQAFAQDGLDRIGDEGRLVEELADVETGRCRCPRHIERRLHPLHHVESGSVAVLDHGQQHGAQTVFAHDVLLHGIGIAHLADILDIDGRAVRIFERDVVEIADRSGDRVGVDRVLLVADLGGSGRQSEILRIDRVHDVERGKPLGQQLGGVEIDHDLPVLAAGRRRKGHPVHGGQLLTQAIDAVVVELLLIESV